MNNFQSLHAANDQMTHVYNIQDTFLYFASMTCVPKMTILASQSKEKSTFWVSNNSDTKTRFKGKCCER